MRAAKPSLTARLVAVGRGKLERPVGERPDLAGEAALVADLALPVLGDRMGIPMGRRTELVDQGLVDALDRGTTQVVIVGAGYDTRALRFAGPGIRFFEVDHPASQLDKKQRLARLGIDAPGTVFVPIDLEVDDLDAGLEAAGHDGAQPTVFLVEGVLSYLTPDTVTQTLASMRARSAPGSSAVVTFQVTLPVAGVRARWLRATDRCLTLLGEPRRTEFPPGDPERRLIDSGWEIVEAGGNRLQRLAGARRGLLFVARPGRSVPGAG